MRIFEQIFYRSWYGPLRRPVRAVSRRLIDGRTKIPFGPLKGMSFDGRELVCRAGIYELHVQYELTKLLKSGDVFYDIGANNGYLSLLGARIVGGTGMVYALEPLPQNSERVRSLLSDNGLSNFEVVPLAVSESSGRMKFYLGDDRNPYTPSLIRDQRSHELEVEVTTLDEFAAEHRHPDVIKMDIEGAEVMALEGAAKLLSSERPPSWLIEVHSEQIDSRITRMLSDHGYRLSRLPSPIKRNPYPTHIIATKLER